MLRNLLNKQTNKQTKFLYPTLYLTQGITKINSVYGLRVAVIKYKFTHLTIYNGISVKLETTNLTSRLRQLRHIKSQINYLKSKFFIKFHCGDNDVELLNIKSSKI